MTFRFLSIPVTVRGSFWVLSLLFAISRIEQPLLVVEWIAVMGLAIFVHELGHALAFRFYGHQPAIELHGMGGLTHSLSGNERLGPGRDAIVAFAGPFAGYLLALIVWGTTKLAAVPDGPFWSVLVADLLWASAGWSTLNLCPILPLDGGLLMLAGLQARFGARAPLIAHGASLVVAVAAMLASRWAGWTWTLYMCVYFAARNGQMIVALLGGKTTKAPAVGVHNVLFFKAQVIACETWLRRGEPLRAWEAAGELPDEILGATLLKSLGDASFAAKQWKLAEVAGARRLATFADATGAVDAARAAVSDARVDDAFAWLERGIATGRFERARVESDPVFTAMRGDERWTRTIG